MVPHCKGDRVSVQWDIGIPLNFCEVIWDVGNDVIFQKGSYIGVSPVVIPDVGHHDRFPGFREEVCKKDCIFLCLNGEGVSNTCIVHVPVG